MTIKEEYSKEFDPKDVITITNMNKTSPYLPNSLNPQAININSNKLPSVPTLGPQSFLKLFIKQNSRQNSDEDHSEPTQKNLHSEEINES